MLFSLKLFVACVAVWAVLIVGFNRWVDPLQYYRRAENPVFNTNARYQIPGLIRNYDFDTIILGTSLSENFLSSYLDERSGSHSINMAIAGSSAAEQASVARMALDSGKVKDLLWELNYRSFSGKYPNMVVMGEFPRFLYEPSWLTPIHYLFALHTVWWSVRSLLDVGAHNLEYLHYWGDKRARKFDGKRAKLQFCEIVAKGGRPRIANRYESNVERNLASVVQKYPNVTFDLFLPPYSYLNFLLGGEREAFEEFRHEIYILASSSKNVRLHDFMADFDIIGDVTNYKDVEHYSPEISNLMLDHIVETQDVSDAETLRVRRTMLADFLATKERQLTSCNVSTTMATADRGRGVKDAHLNNSAVRTDD